MVDEHEPPLAPEGTSHRAMKECVAWLSICLKIGWSKSSLDDLERVWWLYHDKQGRLKSTTAAQTQRKELGVTS